MSINAIDMHHHYVPRCLLEEAKGYSKSLEVELEETHRGAALSFAGSTPHLLHPELPAVKERLQMMQQSKLARAALEPHTATLGYRLTGEQGETWSRIYNEGIHELVTDYPERFVGIAAVPLQDPPRAARVLEQAICDLKLRGAYIGTNVNGQYYDSPDFDPFWRKAEELDALIIMHPEEVAGGEKMIPYGLQLVCGNPAETTLSLGYIIYGGVFDRFPTLKLCVLHGGGFLPYHLGRFDHGRAVGFGSQSKARPSAYLENLYFDSLVHRVDTLNYLRRIAGADHIMIGTDYPFALLGDWQAVDRVEALDCTDADKLAILAGNSRRLLHLGDPL